MEMCGDMCVGCAGYVAKKDPRKTKSILFEDLPKKLVEQMLSLGVYEDEIREALDVINGRKDEPEGMMTDIAMDIIEAWLEEGE